MIPRTLQIKNFLSYGTDCPPISFEHHTLICLSGNNGHGKSALLDAITWAVWGSARKIQNTVRADQGLLKLGQSSMMVIFDCTINTISYRIKREFELVYGKPKSTLDIGIVHADGVIHSLTEKTIRDTQARIETIIGLDYETFVNSSFLRQGNANEFSKRSPKERKEIISAILGLTMYDAVKKAALDKSKIALQQASTLKTVLGHAQQEKTELDLLLSTYPTFCTELTTITTAWTEQKTLLAMLQMLSAQEETKRQLCLNKQKEYARTHQLYTEKINLFTRIATDWRRYRTTLHDYTHHNKLKNDLIIKEAAYTHAQQTFTTYIALKERIQEWEKKHTYASYLLSQKKVEQYTERKILTDRLEHNLIHIQEQRKNLSIQQKIQEQELQDIHKKIQTQKSLIAAIMLQLHHASEQQSLFEKRKESYHRWTTLGNMIREEHGAQLQRLNLANDHTNPSCPLCEQSLSAARKRFLQTKIGDTLSVHMHRLDRLKKILPRLKKILLEDHTALQILNQQKTELHTLEHTLMLDGKKELSIQEMITTVITSAAQLQAQEVTVTAQKQELTRIGDITTPEIIALEHEIRDYATAITQEHTQLSVLAYDPTHIQALHADIQELQKQLRLFEEHTHNLALQEERKSRIQTLHVELKKEKLDLLEQEKTTESLSACITKLELLKIEEHAALEKERELNAIREKRLIEQGTYNAAQTALASVEKTITEQNTTLEKTESTITDYQSIAAAVGKDGIQAVLIEEAIPEIEENANAFLAQLTNNNAHIMIESLRDLKSGGTRETLDIKISDAQGVRPYEMFSGGEAFRIDFALRIAISKLLANRAGTALQTLIIDEGFGSQDEEGLSAIMDLLQILQREFAKIIVVSHLPMMKDQFPVHFHVEKGSHGSIVHIIEQG